jgi:Protein of unknown function (DUF3703)
VFRGYTIMPIGSKHQKLLSEELSLARVLIREARYDAAFLHLERAHVLGQAFVRWHVVAHWLMFKVALLRGEVSAAVGQAIRIVLGAIGSALGRVPVGNTGGSNVSMFRRMEIAPELAAAMQDDRPSTSA